MTHSASVNLTLHINGESLPISQVATDWFILDSMREINPGPARLEIVIDADDLSYDIEIVYQFGTMCAYRTAF